MAKIDKRPMEKMRLTIEFADNGIILRNPDIEDEVNLALTGNLEYKYNGDNGYLIDHSEEYKVIGQKIYDWLTEVVVAEYSGYWKTIGAELDIVAILQGRQL